MQPFFHSEIYQLFFQQPCLLAIMVFNRPNPRKTPIYGENIQVFNILNRVINKNYVNKNYFFVFFNRQATTKKTACKAKFP